MNPEQVTKRCGIRDLRAQASGRENQPGRRTLTLTAGAAQPWLAMTP